MITVLFIITDRLSCINIRVIIIIIIITVVWIFGGWIEAPPSVSVSSRSNSKLVPSSALPALWRVLYSKFYDLWLAVVDLVPSSLIDQSEGKIWSK